MYEKINNYITDLSYEYTNEVGGGIGYNEKSNQYMYIVVVVGILVVVGCVKLCFVKKSKNK